MCNNKGECNNCFDSIINTILTLQNTSNCTSEVNYACDKPFLGNCAPGIVYNTRPITLYTCCNNTLWQMPYNDAGDLSSVFRLEGKNECCITLRVLAPVAVAEGEPITYSSTNNFFTINLNCVGSIKCLSDTYIACI